MRNIVILISGGGSNMRAIVEASRREQWESQLGARVAAVLSNRPDAAGLAWAQEQGLATAVVDHRAYPSREAFDAALLQAIAPFDGDEREPALVVLAGFMRILTPGFVRRWEGRMLNIHPSLLPKYPGLHTHARALAAGDAEAGCTVHLVTAELDAGPILGQARVPVQPGDTPETLAARVLEVEHRLYPAVLRRFAAGERAPLMLP